MGHIPKTALSLSDVAEHLRWSGAVASADPVLDAIRFINTFADDCEKVPLTELVRKEAGYAR
jgi:hypothetical protein